MAGQSEKKICLKCQHQNPEALTVCQKCGAPLKPTTVPVPDLKKELVQQAQKPVTKKKTDELVKQIALWVRNEPKPVLVDIGRGHVLGRRTSASDPPDLVDLTEYGAYRLGVSRRHAQFECSEDGCIAIDLGSSNGTWVNGLRLEPYQPAHVKSGDRINLGRMEFSIGYALSDAPPSGPLPELEAKTEPRVASVSPSPTSQSKADAQPDSKAPAPITKPSANAATSTAAVDAQPEEGSPEKRDAAKETAERAAVAPSAEAKPAEVDKKPPEAKPAESAAVTPAPAKRSTSDLPEQPKAEDDKQPAEDDKKPQEEAKKPPESGA